MKLTIVSAGIELRKIFLRKKYCVLLLIQLAACLFAVLTINSNGLNNLGISLDVPAVPFILLSVLNSVFLPLIIFMLASDVFSSEIESASIKCALLRPISRAKIYLSKIFAILSYILINLMATLILITISRFVLHGAVSDFSNLFTAYFLSIVPMIAFVTMAAFFALCVNNSPLAMFSCFIVYIIMQGVTLITPQIGAIFFTSHLGWYKMFQGLSIDFGTVLNTLLLFLSSSVLLGLGGYALIERKQL